MLGVQKIGRYEVLTHLASGGMGQVYLARSKGLGGFERQVVVKTLDLSITEDDESFVTMFLDEARLVGALHHQYIAPVYEVGCDEEGRYYLVMDYVHGETTEHVFRASTESAVPISLSFALTVVSCVASALDYAHGLCAADGTPLDIVHRDISLSNVMVGYDGAVKLIDFGIAKAANRATKTQVGTLKGKIGYLAPEQVLRKDVDHRADIFALGIVLYELTTVTRAFRESSDLITLERITSGEVRRPSDVVPGYPPELERIVMKALQVDPAERFQDAGTMGRELEALAARMSLPLGHAAVIGVMQKLFGDQRRRRRFARGSDVQTDPSIQAQPIENDEEKTPIVEVPGEETERHALPRAQRPTTPIGGRREVATANAGALSLDDMPTPMIPLDDLPALPREHSALPLAAPRAPSPRVRPGHEDLAVSRVATGPQLPVVTFREPSQPIASSRPSKPSPSNPTEPTSDDDLADLPTHIMPHVANIDPMELDTQRRMPTATVHTMKKAIADAVASKVKPAFSTAARTWLFLCGLFVVAVATAIVIALL